MTNNPTLRSGSTGADVARWQRLIGILACGTFDQVTLDATKAWQYEHGLVADGVVGPLSWATVADVFPTMPQGTLLGVDTSEYQGMIDVKGLLLENTSFAFIKATDGKSAVDPKWAYNADAAAQFHLAYGAYHVLEPNTSAADQAAHFLATVYSPNMTPPTLAPMLDFELAKGLSATAALGRAVTWLTIVEQKIGRVCFLYTGSNFFSTLVQFAGKAGNVYLPEFEKRPLYLADYRVRPIVPEPWDHETIWQFAGGTYRMKNDVPVDLDLFIGSLDTLKSL